MAKKHHSVNYVEFGARNLAAIRKFYEQAFGWQFTEYGPEYLAFNDGSFDGGFALGGPIAEGALVILYSDALEVSKEAVEKAGGSLLQDIYDFPGGRRFHFADPDGNQLAVWSDK